MYGFVTEDAFNRYGNLDNIEWKIIDYLIKSESKYAKYLWKILKYNTPDALSQPDLTEDEKRALVYVGNGESTDCRVFLSPYVDDGWEVQCSHLHIYVNSLIPTDHLIGSVQVCFELITHNKIINIKGEASKFNPDSNPIELEGGKIITPYKNRSSEMLRCLIAALNGEMVNAVGVLQFNRKMTTEDYAQATAWNNRKFLGYRIVMSTLMSGVSEEV